MSDQNRDAAHAATAARLDRAKSDGDVARSRELVSAIQLCCVVLAGCVSLSIIIRFCCGSTHTVQYEAWISGSSGQSRSLQIRDSIAPGGDLTHSGLTEI